MDLLLNGKRALVTGSSSGIGEGAAKMLAEEGCKVVVHGRNAERAAAVCRAITEKGGEAVVALGDLARADEAAAVAKIALEAFGGIDILVNNAGGAQGTHEEPWLAVEDDLWLETYQMNVMAAVRMIRATVPGMKERGWGRVIQITSAAASQPIPFLPQYGAAKGAMINLSVSLSKSLAGTGVTANSISPGRTLTPAVERGFAKRGISAGLGHSTATVPVGTIDDLAYAITMIASPRSAFITGAHLRVDGGQVQAVN